jgi:hypothetical protein
MLHDFSSLAPGLHVRKSLCLDATSILSRTTRMSSEPTIQLTDFVNNMSCSWQRNTLEPAEFECLLSSAQ